MKEKLEMYINIKVDNEFAFFLPVLGFKMTHTFCLILQYAFLWRIYLCYVKYRELSVGTG